MPVGDQDTVAACESGALANVADEVATQFESHDFVFLGSTHGGKKIHDLLLCLISRPSFLGHATDIVVEFATAARQETMDRFLLELEPIPLDELRPAWFDTSGPELWAYCFAVPRSDKKRKAA